ncbi:MAG: hypothetical protein JST75_03470 [Bacteroidetes bacterium]|nr:hypothetical protein [Bacteroidota bacterium]
MGYVETGILDTLNVFPNAISGASFQFRFDIEEFVATVFSDERDGEYELIELDEIPPGQVEVRGAALNE